MLFAGFFLDIRDATGFQLHRFGTRQPSNNPELSNILTLVVAAFKALFGNQHGRQTKEQNLKRDSPIRTLKGKFISTLLI